VLSKHSALARCPNSWAHAVHPLCCAHVPHARLLASGAVPERLSRAIPSPFPVALHGARATSRSIAQSPLRSLLRCTALEPHRDRSCRHVPLPQIESCGQVDRNSPMHLMPRHAGARRSAIPLPIRPPCTLEKRWWRWGPPWATSSSSWSAKSQRPRRPAPRPHPLRRRR